MKSVSYIVDIVFVLYHIVSHSVFASLISYDCTVQLQIMLHYEKK
jgi:hypothetical protein